MGKRKKKNDLKKRLLPGSTSGEGNKQQAEVLVNHISLLLELNFNQLLQLLSSAALSSSFLHIKMFKASISEH